jgi:hypothetical protein
MPAGELRRTINELTKIQRRAAILISGAFKSTSAVALNVELFITLIPPYRLSHPGIGNKNPNRSRVGPTKVSTATTFPTGDPERGMEPSRSSSVGEGRYYGPARDVGIA